VTKNEKGIRILAPMVGIRRKKDTEAEKDITKQNQPVLVGFRQCTSSMSPKPKGAELPDLKERVQGDVGEYRERLLDFLISQGIALEFKESIAPALGMSYGGRIAILPGRDKAEEFSTLVHELAHEMLHKAERRTATTKTVREPKPRQSPLWFRRPLALTQATHPPTTSTCTTATPHSSPRAWK